MFTTRCDKFKAVSLIMIIPYVPAHVHIADNNYLKLLVQKSLKTNNLINISFVVGFSRPAVRAHSLNKYTYTNDCKGPARP